MQRAGLILLLALWQGGNTLSQPDPIRNYLFHRHFAEGCHFLMEGQLHQASVTLRRALRYGSQAENGSVLHVLGMISLDQGKVSEARAQLEKALRLNPSRTEVLLHLSYVHYRLGELGLALQCLDRLLEKEPDHPQARHSRSAIQQAHSSGGKTTPPGRGLAFQAGVTAPAFSPGLEGPMFLRSGTLSGVVRDEGARPVAGASLVVTDLRGEEHHATRTEADGRYSVTGLDLRGHYNVFLSSPGYETRAFRLLKPYPVLFLFNHEWNLRSARLPVIGDYLDPRAVPAEPHRFRFVVDAMLVNLGISVLDGRGRTVFGLGQENFQVLEDGLRQEVRFFESENAPLRVGILLDTSGSMTGGKLEKAKAAVEALVKSFRAQDQVFLLTFHDRVEALSEFTPDFDSLRDRMLQLRADGNTSLYDALKEGLDRFRNVAADSVSGLSRNALILVTDGRDVGSRRNLDQVLAEIQRSSVPIFAIGLYDLPEIINYLHYYRINPLFGQLPHNPLKILQRLASVSGGLAFFPDKAQQVEEIFRLILGQLRSQYNLAYVPRNRERDGRFRRIDIQVINEQGQTQPYFVAGREGYVLPSYP
ncbi:MAG: VWA domain-containing protein [Acidobacteria bacterium]|nr:VWA domain-containing protein [Acidobacteriota bacterium]